MAFRVVGRACANTCAVKYTTNRMGAYQRVSPGNKSVCRYQMCGIWCA